MQKVDGLMNITIRLLSQYGKFSVVQAGSRRMISSSAASVGVAPAVLPSLPYDVSALEPAVSARIMELHHGKHHAAYVTNYNIAMEKMLDSEAKQDIVGMIGLQQAVKFNGGGHINHSIFWTNLCPVKVRFSINESS